MNTDNTAALRDRLNDYISWLDEAIALAHAGTVPDMRAMGPDVDGLLAELRAAPLETGHALADRIAAMIGRLEMLEAAVQALRNALTEDQ